MLFLLFVIRGYRIEVEVVIQCLMLLLVYFEMYKALKAQTSLIL